MRRAWLVLGVATAVAAGCGGTGTTQNNGGGGTGTRTGGNVGGTATTSDTGTGGAGNSGTTTTSTSSGTTTIDPNSGLPCDIAAILSASCTSCHGSPPTAGAPVSLLTYAELTATKNGQSYAAISLARMKSATAPMPPGGASAADIATWQAWVSAGTPMGSCSDVDAGPPDTTFTDPASHTCDGSTQSATCKESSRMNPGMPCIGCHNTPGSYSPPCSSFSPQGPYFSVAGTVFARGHVPDGCRTTTVDLSQAQVIITDKNGVAHTLPVNSVGNFYNEGNIATPYTAKVVYQGKTRAMAAAQTDGDCNTCHSESGINGAPGRVALPVP